FALLDPVGRLIGLRDLVEAQGGEVIDGAAELAESRASARDSARSDIGDAAASQPVILATAWSDELDVTVRAGAQAIVLLTGAEASPFPTPPMPFWREAVKLIEPHPAWGDFPHDGLTDLQFYGMATDAAIDS